MEQLLWLTSQYQAPVFDGRGGGDRLGEVAVTTGSGNHLLGMEGVGSTLKLNQQLGQTLQMTCCQQLDVSGQFGLGGCTARVMNNMQVPTLNPSDSMTATISFLQTPSFLNTSQLFCHQGGGRGALLPNFNTGLLWSPIVQQIVNHQEPQIQPSNNFNHFPVLHHSWLRGDHAQQPHGEDVKIVKLEASPSGSEPVETCENSLKRTFSSMRSRLPPKPLANNGSCDSCDGGQVGVVDEQNREPVTRIKRRRKARTGGTSKYRGVSYHARDKRYMARLWNSYTGKTEHLGSFVDEVDAARAVDKRALVLYGKDDPEMFLNIS